MVSGLVVNVLMATLVWVSSRIRSIRPCAAVVEVYPSGTGVKDEVGVRVGCKGVDGNAGGGVFEDEVDESLCCGGGGLVGVGVDVAGDDGGGGTIAGQR